ncbi:MAG TPA: hypothetical protein PK643_04555 [Saprospiraceae bacterium]|nr:hypothetical protein [Saprospiraceae bacterium]
MKKIMIKQFKLLAESNFLTPGFKDQFRLIKVLLCASKALAWRCFSFRHRTWFQLLTFFPDSKTPLYFRKRNNGHNPLLLPIYVLFIGIFLASSNGFSQPVNSRAALFESDEVFQITLRGEMKALMKDRSGDPVYYPLELAYTFQNNPETTIPVEVRTRGHFRRLRENCFYPPLLINFKKNGPQEHTLFSEQNKLKLVMPCKQDQYVIYEWLAYQIYSLVTPNSFRARLVKVQLEESGKKPKDPFYGVLLEEEKQMARRNGLIPVERDLRPQEVQRQPFLEMALFEYLIGNTDWSIQYLQNIKLIAKDTNAAPIAVPYDFDHSGIVNAPYAHPAPELKMNSIKQRRYRGYCIQAMDVYAETIARFQELKPAIYAIYQNNPLIDEKYQKTTIRFLDEFYETLQNPQKLEKDLLYPCDPNGTGNVVIQGLREH